MGRDVGFPSDRERGASELIADAPSRAASRARTRFTRYASRGALTLWALTSVVIGGTLMIGHWVTLPVPSSMDGQFGAQLSTLRPAQREHSWLLVHVLYSQCACSRRVIGHLFGTTRPTDADEVLLLVGADAELERRALDAGWHPTVVTPAELKARFSIESAPLLLVLDQDDRVRYAGGYTDRKQAPEIHDLDVLAGLRAGQAPSALPLYGCGVSAELQAKLDPLGIKYQ